MCLREKESPYEGDSERNTSKQTAEEGGQVAVGMGFQTVVAGRSIWFRRSLSWVQPVALPHVQSNDNRKSPLLITLHVNALSYLLVTVAHYCVPAKGR